MATKKRNKNLSKNKFVKKAKIASKNIKKCFLKTWKNDPISILVPGISLILLILMTFKLGFIFSLILLCIINGVYFFLNKIYFI